MLIRVLTQSDLPGIRDLSAEAGAEGFVFLTRFLTDLAAGRASLDSSREHFLGALIGERLIAIGGVTPDPYTTHPEIGRVRHLYVHTARRGQGVGRALVKALEAWAQRPYRTLRLRTDTEAASQFYEHLGYSRVTDPAASHYRVLRPSRETSAGGTMDEDVEAMTHDELIAEVRRLRAGIREHRDSTGQDLCWHHPALWGLLPEKTDPLPAVPSWPEFLRGCVRYRQSLDDQLKTD